MKQGGHEQGVSDNPPAPRLSMKVPGKAGVGIRPHLLPAKRFLCEVFRTGAPPKVARFRHNNSGGTQDVR